MLGRSTIGLYQIPLKISALITEFHVWIKIFLETDFCIDYSGSKEDFKKIMKKEKMIRESEKETKKDEKTTKKSEWVDLKSK